MPQRRNLLDLTQYGQKFRDLDRFRTDLFVRLEPIIFSFDTIQDFHFEALKYIKPVNKRVTKNPQSIDQGIAKVVDYFFGNRTDVKVYRLSKGGSKTPVKTKTYDEDPTETFQTWILGFKEAPSRQLNNLKPNVEQDLRDANELIKFYEGLDEVKDFLNTRKVRPFHRTKTILDFYSRCLEERQKILDYYLEGVYERAITKSRAQIFPGFGLQSFDFWKDYPYELGRYPYGRALDFREIDCVSHRLSEIPVRFNGELTIWYQEDKERFYKEYFRIRPIEQLFDNISTNIEHLPMTNYRGHIFDELKTLFKKKQWFAFYALALPQVEGLFAEMVKSANPDSGIATKTLPDKVRSVRPDYELSDAYFDYYEYKLPEQRNSFSHTGFVVDVKLKAYDILVDLEHILSVYASLENPLVAVSKVIKNRNTKDFSDFIGFAEYFTLLEALPMKHKSEPKFKKVLDEFNQTFLRKECSIETIVRHAEANIDFGFSSLWSVCKNSIRKFENEQSWTTIHRPRLKKLLTEEDFKRNSEEFFRFNEDEVSMVFSIRSFFNGVDKYILKGKIPEEMKVSFDAWNGNKSFAKWILDFKNLIPELLD